MYHKYAALLKERNLTTYRVAKDTGLKQNTFSYWKKGKSNPKVDKLQILANYFDVPLEYFLKDEKQPVQKV